MYCLKMIKKEREEEIMNKIIQKLLSYKNGVYIEYNPEDNSYQIKVDNKQDEKDILLKGLEVLTKKIKKKIKEIKKIQND